MSAFINTNSKCSEVAKGDFKCYQQACDFIPSLDGDGNYVLDQFGYVEGISACNAGNSFVEEVLLRISGTR